MKSIDESFFQLLWQIPEPGFGFDRGIFIDIFIESLIRTKSRTPIFRFHNDLVHWFKSSLYNVNASNTGSREKRNNIFLTIQEDKILSYKKYEDISALYDITGILDIITINEPYIIIGVKWSTEVNNFYNSNHEHLYYFLLNEINTEQLQDICSSYEKFRNYQDSMKLLRI